MEDWSEMDGAAAVEKASSLPYFATGSARLDALLGGGYRAGRLVEVFGSSNSGKTQLAMQAALMAASRGVRSLYVDTEGSFRPERIEQMAVARGLEPSPILEKVVYLRAASMAEQREVAAGVSRASAFASCRVVIVDSLTKNFTLELPGRSNLAARQGALGAYLSEMARDAFLHSRAYVLTNRVTFGAKLDVGIGGRTVEQLVHRSLRLERAGDTVRLTDAAGGVAALKLDEKGLT